MNDTKPDTAPAMADRSRVVVEDQTPGLLRYYLIAGWVTLVVLTVVLGLLYRRMAVSNLTHEIESQNIALARQFTNRLWPEFGAFVRAASDMSGDELREHPQSSRLRQAILKQVEGQPVVRVSLYGEDGLIVFSTQTSEIGQYTTDREILDIVTRQRYWYTRSDTTTELTHHDTFDALDSTIERCDLVSSYMTVPSGRVVLEIYQDVTPSLRKIKRIQAIGIGTVTLISTLLLGFSLFSMRRKKASMQGEEA